MPVDFLTNFLWVSGFGIFGLLLRFGIDQWALQQSYQFPMSTWIINVSGSALAGLVFVLSERQLLASHVHLGLLVGFCGGFTTFSAYSLQSLQMIERGELSLAMIYFVLSPLTGLLATFLSVLISRQIFI